MISFKYGDNSIHFLKDIKKLKSFLLSYFHTAGQSWSEEGVNVVLTVSESYRNGQTQLPLIQTWKGVEGGGFRNYMTVGEAGVTRYAGPFIRKEEKIHYPKNCRARELNRRGVREIKLN